MPGVSSIRAVARFALLLAFPVAIILAMFVNHWWQSERVSRHNSILSRILIVLSVVFIVLKQQHRSIPTFNKNAELEKIKALALKGLPQSCKTFYVEPAPHVHYPTFALHIDAMYLSSEFKIPTINGSSGLSPKGWNIWEINSPNYQTEVQNWVQLHKIEPAPCKVEIDR